MAIVLEQHSYGGTGVSATFGTATFGVTPTSGNVLVTAVAINKSSGTLTEPTGWTVIDMNYVSGSVSGGLAYKISDGTEGAVTWNWINSQSSVAFVAEYSGVDSLDVHAAADSGVSAVSSQTTGTTATTAIADSLVFAIHGIDTYANYEPGETLSNSFVSIGTPTTTNDTGLVPSSKIVSSTGTQETTLTKRAGGVDDQVFGKIAVFNLAAAGVTVSVPAGVYSLAGEVPALVIETNLLIAVPVGEYVLNGLAPIVIGDATPDIFFSVSASIEEAGQGVFGLIDETGISVIGEF